MHNIRRTAAEDRVVFIFTGGRKTLRAALLQTDSFFQTKVPATWSLAQVATNRTKIANLRSGNGMRRFSQARKTVPQGRMFFELSERHEGPNSQSALAICNNFIEPADALQIYQARRPREIILHRG